MIRRNRISIPYEKGSFKTTTYAATEGPESPKSGSIRINQSELLVLNVVRYVRFLRFDIRFADAITEHLLEHGDALPQQLGVL